MKKSDGFPEIGIRPALLREMFHGIRHGITMPAQTFRLNPFVQNRERAFLQHQVPHVTTKRFRFGNKSVAATFVGRRRFKYSEGALCVFVMDSMITLFQDIAFVVLVGVSLAGFIVALVWTLAIWFGKSS
jgi:hypothetical protein